MEVVQNERGRGQERDRAGKAVSSQGEKYALGYILSAIQGGEGAPPSVK